jgi:hypothetical protein
MDQAFKVDGKRKASFKICFESNLRTWNRRCLKSTARCHADRLVDRINSDKKQDVISFDWWIFNLTLL